MITEFFIDCGFGLASGLFDMLPEISWDVDTSAFQYFVDILKVAGYMFPWNTVVAIVTIIFGLTLFRIVVAGIRFLVSLL